MLLMCQTSSRPSDKHCPYADGQFVASWTVLAANQTSNGEDDITPIITSISANCSNGIQLPSVVVPASSLKSVLLTHFQITNDANAQSYDLWGANNLTVPSPGFRAIWLAYVFTFTCTAKKL